MSKYYTIFITETILLSIGRAILRKQERDNQSISDYEARGHAMVLQARYKLVNLDEQDLFCDEVVRAFNYVKERRLEYISKKGYISFKAGQFFGTSVLDEELFSELKVKA